MKYRSTRGSDDLKATVDFETAVLEGLAKDGGLYIPTSIPKLNLEQFNQFRESGNDFNLLAVKLISLFINREEISYLELVDIVHRSYLNFDHPEITPVIQLSKVDQFIKADDPIYLVELFHGPTFAFKDVALQFLGNLFEFFLKRKNLGRPKGDGLRHRITVLGATSGDTGSAAIYGLRNKADIDVFILHPEGKVSKIQEAQMTMVLDSNVHNGSIPGNFDDCQNIVKKLFEDEAFRNRYRLGAVNSINWARILVQIVYYFKAYFALEDRIGRGAKVIFSVPTGNFGDILAGHYARQMGLPVERLIIATNQNDVLHRVLVTGFYAKSVELGVQATHSPAMDIVVSSNFERLLWYLAEIVDGSRACATLANWMSEFSATGKVQLPELALDQLRKWFSSCMIDDATTLEFIRKYYAATPDRYLLDPHTAVGVGAAHKLSHLSSAPTLCLATAHPAKFPSAIQLALRGVSGEPFEFAEVMGQGYLPEPFRRWMDPSLPRRKHRLASTQPQAVKDWIISVLEN